MKIKKTYILPAEWYPQDAIQLTWPHVQTDWAPYLDDITQTYLQLADTITKYEYLIVATPEPDHVWQLLKNNLADEQIEKILFYLIDSNDTIVWLPGLKKSNLNKTKQEKCDIIIKYY